MLTTSAEGLDSDFAMPPSFTVFTVSHSITLTLPTLGYVHVPQQPVERVIALSIVFVAAEILRGRAGHVDRVAS